MLFKITLVWFLGAYSLDTLMNSYKTMKSENTFTEMKDFMYRCQEREDKLRERCDLQMYRIPGEHTFMENLMDKYYINTNYYLSYKMDVTTYDEFINLSYDETNVGMDIVFEGSQYTLQRVGIKASPTYSYANQQYERIPQTPIWTLKLNDRTLTITGIN